ncbi:hypothetical protein EDB85DRAFT_1888431 [Lactarius pseudohatsudake]|nr:hypothetical protein EDB85DRAFT_1888431 [Lactarius pseudohatsudake]
MNTYRYAIVAASKSSQSPGPFSSIVVVFASLWSRLDSGRRPVVVVASSSSADDGVVAVVRLVVLPSNLRQSRSALRWQGAGGGLQLVLSRSAQGSVGVVLFRRRRRRGLQQFRVCRQVGVYSVHDGPSQTFPHHTCPVIADLFAAASLLTLAIAHAAAASLLPATMTETGRRCPELHKSLARTNTSTQDCGSFNYDGPIHNLPWQCGNLDDSERSGDYDSKAATSLPSASDDNDDINDNNGKNDDGGKNDHWQENNNNKFNNGDIDDDDDDDNSSIQWTVAGILVM